MPDKLIEKILLWVDKQKKKKPEVLTQANTGFSNENYTKPTI